LGLVACFLGAGGVSQENRAYLSAVSLWVQVAPAEGRQRKAGRLGMELPEGCRVATDKRSQAEIRFLNGNILRMASSSTIVLIPEGVRLERGRIYGEYSRPGVVRGRWGSAAFAEACFEYLRTSDGDVIRCWSGEGLWGSDPTPQRGGGLPAGSTDTGEPKKGAWFRTGFVDSGTPVSLTDPSLTGLDRGFIGGVLRLYAPDGTLQEREITSIDAATGTVTVSQVFSPPPARGFAYLIVASGKDVVSLKAGQEIAIAPPLRAILSPISIASGEEDLRYPDVPAGQEVLAFQGSMAHQRWREERFLVREGMRLLAPSSGPSDKLRVVLNPIPSAPLSPFRAEYPTLFGRALKHPSGGRLRCQPSCGRTAKATAFGRTPPAGQWVEGPSDRSFMARQTNHPPFKKVSGIQPGTLREGQGVRAITPPTLRLEGMGAGSEGKPAWSQGLRASLSTGRSSRLLIAGRWLSLEGKERSDLTRASLEWRSESSGDWRAGRLLIFPTPANNTASGTLISFDVADGALWSPPLFGERPLNVGYLSNTDPLYKRGFSGWYLQFRGGFWGSQVDATLLKANGRNRHTGSSLDISIPVAIHVLDLYGEYGEDPYQRRFYMAGLYLPWLYRQCHLDLFVEHAGRAGLPRQTSVHLYYDLGSGLRVMAALDKSSRLGSATGIGAMYRLEF